MKTLSLLIGLTLLCLVAAEKKKDAGGLADKVSQLVDLSTKKSVIKLNGNKVFEPLEQARTHNTYLFL